MSPYVTIAGIVCIALGLFLILPALFSTWEALLRGRTPRSLPAETVWAKVGIAYTCAGLGVTVIGIIL